MRVFAVLVDIKSGKVGLNQKDSTLPEKLAKYEGLINLFGGKVDPGETPEVALSRELQEEIPGFVTEAELAEAAQVHADEHAIVYAIPTDLSGHRKTRGTDRIGQLAQVCLEGDGIVRTIGFIRDFPDGCFVTGAKPAIIKAYEHFAA